LLATHDEIAVLAEHERAAKPGTSGRKGGNDSRLHSAQYTTEAALDGRPAAG
jgi:hypothetical protein